MPESILHLPTAVTSKNVYRHCQISPGEQTCPWLSHCSMLSPLLLIIELGRDGQAVSIHRLLIPRSLLIWLQRIRSNLHLSSSNKVAVLSLNLCKGHKKVTKHKETQSVSIQPVLPPKIQGISSAMSLNFYSSPYWKSPTDFPSIYMSIISRISRLKPAFYL